MGGRTMRVEMLHSRFVDGRIIKAQSLPVYLGGNGSCRFSAGGEGHFTLVQYI